MGLNSGLYKIVVDLNYHFFVKLERNSLIFSSSAGFLAGFLAGLPLDSGGGTK